MGWAAQSRQWQPEPSAVALSDGHVVQRCNTKTGGRGAEFGQGVVGNGDTLGTIAGFGDGFQLAGIEDLVDAGASLVEADHLLDGAVTGDDQDQELGAFDRCLGAQATELHPIGGLRTDFTGESRDVGVPALGSFNEHFGARGLRDNGVDGEHGTLVGAPFPGHAEN